MEKFDIFHPNDIDVLYSNQSQKSPGFTTGDLLLSFRNLNLIVIFDPVRKQIKWRDHGPWRFQHDPDFTDDGKFSVYNNNRWRNRSGILKNKPITREVTNDLIKGELDFYSGKMGKHQYLPNGNVLITAQEEGRIIEVNDKGMKVLAFNNMPNAKHNVLVENGIWLPKKNLRRDPVVQIK